MSYERRYKPLKRSDALADLSDVTITSAAAGDLLMHNGTAWVDATTLTGDYTFSGTTNTFDSNLYVDNGNALRVYDSTTTDYGEFTHNGVDLVLNTTNTSYFVLEDAGFQVWNADQVKFNVAIGDSRAELRDGFAFRMLDATDTDYVQFAHNGTDFRVTAANTTSFEIDQINFQVHDASGSVLNANPTAKRVEARQGARFRALDSTNTDTFDFYHDGTDGQIVTNNGDIILDAGATTSVQDNGGASPVFEVVCDDSSPWAVGITRTDYADSSLMFAHKGDGTNLGWVFEDTPYAYSGGDYNHLVEISSDHKTTSETVTSSTTLQDDDEITAINLRENQWYRIYGFFEVECASTSVDFKLRMVFTDTPANNGTWMAIKSDAVGNTDTDMATAVSSQLLVDLIGGQRSTVHVTGYFQSNASTGGTMKLQWAQGSSSASGLTVYAPSFVAVQPIWP